MATELPATIEVDMFLRAMLRSSSRLRPITSVW